MSIQWMKQYRIMQLWFDWIKHRGRKKKKKDCIKVTTLILDYPRFWVLELTISTYFCEIQTSFVHTLRISMEVHVGITRWYTASLTLFSKLCYNWVLHMRASRDTHEIQRQTGIHFLYQLWYWGISWTSALLQSCCWAAFQFFTASLINALIENASRKTSCYVKLIWFHILS